MAELLNDEEIGSRLAGSGWNKVRLSVTNHSAGGLTNADFELAKQVDDLD